MIQMNKTEAISLILSSQGLHQKDFFGLGKAGALKALEQIGYVQIDTISVVERAHHHVFHSRVSDYHPQHLHEMVSLDKTAFEYWSHAAAYLPMRDFRFSLIRKQRFSSGESFWFKETPEHKKIRKQILTRFKREGALSTNDFQVRSTEVKGWFQRTPEKQVLEQLFAEGVLMVKERRGFQKIYDLTENILPTKVNTKTPTMKEYAKHLILSSLKAQGLLNAKEIAYLRVKNVGEAVRLKLNELLKQGRIVTVQIDQVEGLYYALPDALESLDDSNRPLERFVALSPFDNLVIQRKRLKDIFNFDYQIECYVPKAKRKYGYFSLPLLKGSEFIGSVDTKAERSQKELWIQNFYVTKKKAFKKKDLEGCLRPFAEFNQCEKILWSLG